jgi:pimeloyl-ACP methyl ester carboxylesterase
VRAIGLAVVLSLVSAAGAWPQVLDDRRVDAGGTTLRVRCGGQRRAGTPAVVLEAGAFNTVDTWRDVHAPIAGFARVCGHDRPGRGDSGPAPPGLDAKGYVALLAAALRAAGEPPPYVLVGHSLGGLLAQVFVAERRDEVAGVVLVDSSHPDQVRRMAGLPRPRITPPARPPAPEAVSLDALSAALGHAPPRMTVPLVVLTRSRWTNGGDGPDDLARLARWNDLQRELAALSPQARHVVAPASGHYVQNDAPELVVDAVRQLVGAGLRR